MRKKYSSPWKQGLFTPLYPEKYSGDLKKITYRSGWELRVMMDLDNSPDVVSWSSEPVAIPYFDISTKKSRRYYPDFMVKKKDDSIWMIEVKPERQTKPPKEAKTKRGGARYLKEVAEYGKNLSKWQAAKSYCEKQGWKFIVVSEKEK